jgi:hypothetical protein
VQSRLFELTGNETRLHNHAARERTEEHHGVVAVEERLNISFNSSSGRSSSEIRPRRGVSMSVISAMTIRDEKWKNESLKNRVTPGSSRLVTDQPQAATGHA